MIENRKFSSIKKTPNTSQADTEFETFKEKFMEEMDWSETTVCSQKGTVWKQKLFFVKQSKFFMLGTKIYRIIFQICLVHSLRVTNANHGVVSKQNNFVTPDAKLLFMFSGPI